MVNINFHQTTQPEDARGKKRVVSGSLFVSTLILVVSFLTFFGLKIYKSNIKNETASVKGQISEELNNIGKENMSRVADFQKRMEEIETGLSISKNPKDVMSKVESLMVPGVVLTSYEYNSSKKSLALEAISDSFKTIAEQILSLKSSSYFKDVRVSKTARDDEGRINFSLESQLVLEENI